MVAEGPLGGAGRGSWLVSARRSNLDWPRRPDGERNGTVFGFGDGLAKLVYDVSQTQQIAVSLLGGRSSGEEDDEGLPHELAVGVNRTAVMNLAWRSTLGPATVVSQRFYLVGHRFQNRTLAGRAAGRGTHGQLAYRADLVRDVAGSVFDAGVQVERLDTSLSSSLEIALNPNWRRSPSAGDRIAGSSWLRSGYAHYTWAVLPRLTLAPGVRVAHSSAGPRPAVSPWLLAEWALVPGWTVDARVGRSHQFPGFELAGGGLVVGQLRPERATHVDLGVEHRLSQSTRWQVTFFTREEDDVLALGTHPLFVGGTLARPDRSERLENTLRGAARGVELLLERRSATGLSGWVAYSFGETRYTDALDGRSFWGNFDQRHAITLSGVYRVTENTVLGVNLRGGSNFPIPGYLGARDGGLFVAQRRNETRLPAYVRLDARISRSFTYVSRRMSVFAEILNVLNRTNLGTANGVVRPETGEAVGFTRALLPRLPSVGVVVEF